MSLKKISLLVVVLCMFFSFADAKAFCKVASVKPVFLQHGKEKAWCPVCGMSIKMFYKTSHGATLKDNTPRQYCSMRCLVVDMQKHDIDLGSIKVVDASTQKLIDAQQAFYVVGSKVKGTMSKVSKLAFASKDDAKEFVKKHKGKIVDFKTALKMAKESLKSDIAMVDKKKRKKIYPMGKKIFTKMCKKDIDLSNYVEINELKADIKEKHLCKPLKAKQLQALSLYLWEVKRFGDDSGIKNLIKVTKDEKCPVCGMFVYKYPRWVAQIFYKHNSHQHHYSFDGVKDMMKFYFDSKKWGTYKEFDKNNITKILVSDYYSQNPIDATKAYYVIGSDVYGPMGNELIPFKNKSDAKRFLLDHRAKKILRFNQLTPTKVYKLDD